MSPASRNWWLRTETGYSGPARKMSEHTMRKLMTLVVILCGAASVYAAEPLKLCAQNGAVITRIADGDYFLDGKKLPVFPDDVDGLTWQHVGEPQEGDADQSGDDYTYVDYDGQAYWPCEEKKD